MKFVDEYRSAEASKRYFDAIDELVSTPWTIMEVCGGQTHSIVKFGIDEVLPKKISLVHGPGCPVCVTPIELIDKAIEIALKPNVVFCSFGDMLRVPGSTKDLQSAKAEGADVRMVYSPLDALKIAQDNPALEVVFFGIGFETTAPGNAMAVFQACQLGVKNFSMLVSHVLVPPALEAILSSADTQVKGFLAAGHVCTVMGFTEYEAIADRYKVPIVVTGFEPLDILQGVYMCIKQLEKGTYKVENQYTRSVKRQGNIHAKRLIEEVFETIDRKWRGIGNIAASGLQLKEKYLEFDAEKRFGSCQYKDSDSSECIIGEILQGKKKPVDCSLFDVSCTPEKPVGATMVSSEGACAAYYRYRRAQDGKKAG